MNEQEDKLSVEKTPASLKRDYIAVSKTRLKPWQAGLI